ncbi:MAG: FtsX-like permease family protein [Holophagales bacterium]|nr:FtsX-like permease family protein [Holophagales bacterium]MYD21658.1 FtsX-like permease family protein [Holophagales bacterium]MYI31676.1 FtsX-like permease family protein [Holophagales bacterium]
MRPRVALRYSLRELRGSLGRVWVWVSCLSVGVGAVVSVAGLASSVDGAIRGEARKLLAADLVFRSRGPIPEDVLETIDGVPGAARAEVREMAAMVGRASPLAASPGAASPAEVGGEGPASLLAELKAVSGGYPFYGELVTEPPLAAGTSPADVLGDHSALVSPEALSRLDLEVGDDLRLGRRTLRIIGSLEGEPDRLPTGFAFGPRVVVGVAAQEAARIFPFAGFGGYRVLVRLPGEHSLEELETRANALRGEIDDNAAVRVETYADAQPGIREDLERLSRYLGLVALLSLLVGGVGVAQGIRAWLTQRLDALAVLKCLGARPRDLMRTYVVQAVLLGLVAGVIGGVAGLLSILLVPAILGGALPVEAVSIWQPWAFGRGVALGIGVSTAFSAPALLVVLRAPPVRVFRSGAEPLPGSRLASALSVFAVGGGVAGSTALQAGSLWLALRFMGAVVAAVVALILAALALRRLARFLAPRCRSSWLRYGVAALARPESGTLAASVALGMGLMVLLAMFVVQGHLHDELAAGLPDEAPSAFLLNVPATGWGDLAGLLERQGARRVQSAPVVMARVRAIDGVPVAERLNERNRWALRRQLRLTFLDELPADNVILEASGAATALRPWVDPALGEVSVEQDFAETIGVSVGSTIDLEVGGRETRITVTSLRRVDWEGFGINFFLVVEPAVLDWAPHTRLAAAWLPQEREQRIQDEIYVAYPGVAVVRIREVLQKVVDLVSDLQVGVRVLGSFTVAAALLTLAGAVAASSARRGREAALLKTIGSTRFDVLRAFAAEYALVGLSAAFVAAVLGSAAAWWLVTRELELAWSFRPWAVFGALAAGSLLSLAVGLLASVGALQRPPIDSLREAR